MSTTNPPPIKIPREAQGESRAFYQALSMSVHLIWKAVFGSGGIAEDGEDPFIIAPSVGREKNDSAPNYVTSAKTVDDSPVFHYRKVEHDDGPWQMIMGMVASLSHKIRNTLIPSGLIAIWSGSTASIPDGWVLCNGLSGTPDLRDRFVVGAGSTYAVDDTGGATNETTSNTTATNNSTSFATNGPNTLKQVASGTGEYVGIDSHVHGTNSHNHTQNAHNHTVDVLPPYYALAYIMKV